jgi:hypothetical protein
VEVDGPAEIALHLNLDAEDELAHGAAAATTRSAATLDAMQRAAARLAPLLPAHIVPRVPGRGPETRRGRAVTQALCWCPTPSALRELRAAGLEPVASLGLALGRGGEARVRASTAPHELHVFPTLDALIRANERATFALVSPLVTALGTSAVAQTFEGAATHLAAAPPSSNWILRRGLSAAGRGARRVRGGARLATGDAAWLRASLALGPVTLDPRVELVRELALHGWLEANGATTLGAVCLQHVDEHGAWLTTERADYAPAEPERDRAGDRPSVVLRDAALRVAATLHMLGYHGPFGIDAYTWRDQDGSLHLRAPSEVNARFSMGWWTGMQAPLENST